MTSANPNSSEEGQSNQDAVDSKTITGRPTEEPAVSRGSKKKTSKKASRGPQKRLGAAKVASKKAISKRSAAETEPETLVTEKPVPLSPAKRTSEYVVTVNNSTGLPTKIEKLDSETGKRKELTEAEYLQMVSAATSQQPLNYLGFGSTVASEAVSDAVTQAYYRGIVDYLNTLSST
jgi:hypothetical protein